MELLYAETYPDVETHQFLLCELAHDLPDPRMCSCPHWRRAVPQPPLSSATYHPKNILPHLRPMVALTWLSSSPYWSEGETYLPQIANHGKEGVWGSSGHRHPNFAVVFMEQRGH